MPPLAVQLELLDPCHDRTEMPEQRVTGLPGLCEEPDGLPLL